MVLSDKRPYCFIHYFSYPVVILDETHNIVESNDIWKELLSTEAKENDFFDKIKQDIFAVYDSKQRTKVNDFHLNGDFYEITLTPLYLNLNRLLMITLVVDNQYKLVKLEQELNGFAYRLSHDFKSPLASLEGMLDYCLDVLDEPQTLDDFLNDSIKLTKDMKSIIKQFQQVMYYGQQEVVYQDIYIKEIQEKIEDEFKEIIELKSAILNITSEEDYIRSDINLILKLICIVVKNSLDYSHPERDPVINIAIKYKGATHFEIVINDNGIGIPGDKFDDVFEMFTRFSHREGGVGLGLYAAKKIVTKLIGNITIASNDSGTTCNIILPKVGKKN